MVIIDFQKHQSFCQTWFYFCQVSVVVQPRIREELPTTDVEMKGNTSTGGGKQRRWATGRVVADGDDQPSSGGRGRVPQPASARGMLWLLRAGALLSSSSNNNISWIDIAYSGFASLLYTAVGGYFAFDAFRNGVAMAIDGKSVVRATLQTGVFGLLPVLSWCSIMHCIWAGRARFRDLLMSVQELLARVVLMSGSEMSVQKLRKHSNWLLIYVICIAILFSVVSFFSVPLASHTSSALLNLMIRLLAIMTSWLFGLCTCLVTFKFILPGLYITIGLWGLNERLQSIAKKNQSLSQPILSELKSLHDELSRAFARLTGLMSFELTVQMTYGTLNLVSTPIFLAISAKDGDLSRYITPVFAQICNAVVTVVLPSELTQKALNAVGETRDLLLSRSEWHLRPELQPELGLFRDTLSRDLETLGDLGQFRLQRSTILSITATVLTYAIVLVQFYVTELTI